MLPSPRLARSAFYVGILALALAGCDKARELAGGQGSQAASEEAAGAIALARKASASGPPVSAVLTPEATQARDALAALIAKQPDNGEVHLALAQLLAPYALVGLLEPTPTPEPPPAEGEVVPTQPAAPPVEPAEVVAEFEAAAGLEASRSAALDGFVAFCREANCLDAVDATFRKLLEASPEDPHLPAGYGDFLVNEMGDREGAIEQYRVALIWRPDDTDLRSRVARVHLARAFDHLEWGEYPQAENAFEESKAWISSTGSPEWARLQEGIARLDRIRPNR
jgi:hypothetical protein